MQIPKLKPSLIPPPTKYIVRFQHSVHMLTGPVLKNNNSSTTTESNRPAISNRQPHIDLVLIVYAKIALEAIITIGFGC